MEARKSIWEQFVEKKQGWIGGTLTDYDMGEVAKTEIVDFVLRPNGESGMWFEVSGKEFSCGADTKYLGLTGDGGKNEVVFSGYGGHRWSIAKGG